ncbi:MAG TPA: hypothetical protein VJ914_27555 [Pseudonocardiaceae bacterium]|nr:hypothetical protein [Pseudonocardiaceae bacterium]
MLARADPGSQRAAFEFAFWRRQSWHTLRSLCADATLTEAGHRLLEGIAERLGPGSTSRYRRRRTSWRRQLRRTTSPAGESATCVRTRQR